MLILQVIWFLFGYCFLRRIGGNIYLGEGWEFEIPFLLGLGYLIKKRFGQGSL